ncbi:MAG: DUF4386 family protein [Solirubrobacteraceae bacterium]
MSAEAQLQYEGRVRYRQAAIAIVAGVLVMVASIIGLTGPHAKVNELTLGLITDHKRHSLDLIAGIVTAVCQVAVAATLVFLFRCSKARRPEAPGFMPILAVAGGTLTAVCAIVNPIILHSKVNEFISTGAQTYDEASRLTGGGVLLALQIGAQLGSLLLAVAVVLIALQSMRVGLLPRPLGYVGILAGALILFPVVVIPIVQMGWLLSLGYLFSGRWSSGVPPAWRTGNAEPWPSSNEMRARRAAANQSTRARRGASTPVPAVDGPAIEADSSPERTRSSTPKRKRKRRT